MHQRGICWGLDVDAEVQCSSLWQGWLHQVMGFTIARALRALRALSFDCFCKLRQCWDVFTPKQVDVFSDSLMASLLKTRNLASMMLSCHHGRSQINFVPKVSLPTELANFIAILDVGLLALWCRVFFSFSGQYGGASFSSIMMLMEASGCWKDCAGSFFSQFKL